MYLLEISVTYLLLYHTFFKKILLNSTKITRVFSVAKLLEFRE